MSVKRNLPQSRGPALVAADIAWMLGFATALVEMHRGLLAAGVDSHLARVARDAGLTLAEARRIGVLPADVERLRRAGVW